MTTKKTIALTIALSLILALPAYAAFAKVQALFTVDANGNVARYPATTVIVASAARTATTTHSTFDVAAFKGSAVGIDPNVTAASGTTPTLNLTVEQSCDGGTSYFTVYDVQGTTFAQATGVVDPALKNFTVYCGLLRTKGTIGGTTPSFTYTISLKKAQ